MKSSSSWSIGSSSLLAAGLLIVPMAWLYIRYKRGAAIEVKL